MYRCRQAFQRKTGFPSSRRQQLVNSLLTLTQRQRTHNAHVGSTSSVVPPSQCNVNHLELLEEEANSGGKGPADAGAVHRGIPPTRMDSTYLFHWMHVLFKKEALSRTRHQQQNVCVRIMRSCDFQNRMRCERDTLRHSSLSEGAIQDAWHDDFAEHFLSSAQIQLPLERFEMLLQLLVGLDYDDDNNHDPHSPTYANHLLTIYQEMLQLVDGFPNLRADLIQTMTVQQARQLGVFLEHRKLIQIADWCRRLKQFRPQGLRFWHVLAKSIEKHLTTCVTCSTGAAVQGRSAGRSHVAVESYSIHDLLKMSDTVVPPAQHYPPLPHHQHHHRMDDPLLLQTGRSKHRKVFNQFLYQPPLLPPPPPTANAATSSHSLQSISEPLGCPTLQFIVYQQLERNIGRRAYMQAALHALHSGHTPFSNFMDQYESLDMEREAPFPTTIHEFAVEGEVGGHASIDILAQEPPSECCSCSCHYTALTGVREKTHCVLCALRVVKGGESLSVQTDAVGTLAEEEMYVLWPNDFTPHSRLRSKSTRRLSVPHNHHHHQSSHQQQQQNQHHHPHHSHPHVSQQAPANANDHVSASKLTPGEWLRRIIVHQEPVPSSYAMAGQQLSIGVRKVKARSDWVVEPDRKRPRCDAMGVSGSSAAPSTVHPTSVVDVFSEEAQMGESPPRSDHDLQDWRSHRDKDWNMESDQALLYHIGNHGYGVTHYSHMAEQLHKPVEEVKARFKYLMYRYNQMQGRSFNESEYE